MFNLKKGENMKTMTKKQLVKQVEKQKSIIAKLQSEYSDLESDYNHANELIKSLKEDIINFKTTKDSLKLDLEDQKKEFLEDKVKLLEKIVSLHEYKPKDTISFYQRGNGVANTTGTTITTSGNNSTII